MIVVDEVVHDYRYEPLGGGRYRVIYVTVRKTIDEVDIGIGQEVAGAMHIADQHRHNHTEADR